MNSHSAAATSNGRGAPPQLRGRVRPAERQAVDRIAAELLVALGADLRAAGPGDTPRRIATAYAELLTPEPFNLAALPNEEGYDELVVVREIPYQSLCASCRSSSLADAAQARVDLPASSEQGRSAPSPAGRGADHLAFTRIRCRASTHGTSSTSSWPAAANMKPRSLRFRSLRGSPSGSLRSTPGDFGLYGTGSKTVVGGFVHRGFESPSLQSGDPCESLRGP
jgi:hypothetical protein